MWASPEAASQVPGNANAVAQYASRRRRDARSRVETVARDLIARLERFRDGAAAKKPAAKEEPTKEPVRRSTSEPAGSSVHDPIVLETTEGSGDEYIIVDAAGGTGEPIIVDHEPILLEDSDEDPMEL